MNRSKKIFLVVAGLFLLLLIIFGYDISRRTTFPGSNKKSAKQTEKSISVDSDSLQVSDKKANSSN